MKVCVEQTIEELDIQIKRLSDLRFGLMAAFAPAETELTTDAKVMLGLERPAPEPPVKIPLDRALKPVGKKGRKVKQTDPKTLERIAIIRKLPEPFTPEQVATATRHDKKLCGVMLCNWASKGWLKRVGPGRYERKAKFPGAAEKAPQENGQGRQPSAPAEPARKIPVELVLREGSLEQAIYFAAKHAPSEFTATSLGLELQRSKETMLLVLNKLERAGYVKRAGEDDDMQVTWKVAR